MEVKVPLIVLAVTVSCLIKNGCCENFKGYVGSHMKKNITVYKQNVTWLDAYRECESLPNGYIAIAENPGPILEYVRDILFNAEVLQGQHLWMGFVKPELKWLRSDSCIDLENNFVLQGSVSGKSGECGLMDMTSNTIGMEWKAALCNEKHPFVCFQETDVMMIYEELPGLKIDFVMPGWSAFTSRIVIDYCFQQLEKEFQYAGFQYNEVDRKCGWLTGHMRDFPITLYTSDAAGANITIRIKTESDEVIISNETISEGVSSANNNEMPCVDELTTTSTTTDPESSTTSTDTTSVLSTLLHTTGMSTASSPLTSTEAYEASSEGSGGSGIHASLYSTTTDETSSQLTSTSVAPTSIEHTQEILDAACSEMERSLNDSNCHCSKLPPAVTKEELEQLVADIQKENSVDVKETSSFKRKLTSAPDERTSSRAIGLAGVIIIISVVVVIVSSDISYVISIIKKMF